MTKIYLPEEVEPNIRITGTFLTSIPLYVE